MDTVVERRRDRDRPAPVSEVSRPSRGFREDIQALRAIAVLAVAVNHLWPELLTGGYIGVDVFFVISGFLISAHLEREISHTGRLRLGRFYARRIRRLLPAALLVTGVSVAAAYFLLPYPRWEANAWQALASALYWENWLLAAQSVDYSAANAAPSLMQHYWSLSVEEQFYLLWPLLLLLLFTMGRARGLFTGIAVVGAASLAVSMYVTEHAPSQAYFITPTRIWEFSLGALVAMAGVRIWLSRIPATLAAGAGLAMIIIPAFGYGPDTPFPGYLALLPTVGTALVIVAGNGPDRSWTTVLLSARPIQFVGNISYSLYLWHWPLILLAPFALGDALLAGKLDTSHRLAILGASLVLAWLTKVLVEDRFRSWSPLVSSTRLTFASMVAGLLAVAVLAGGLSWTYGRHVAQAERDASAQSAGPCHGAVAMVRANGCPAPFGPARVPVMGPANEYYAAPRECVTLDDYRAIEKPTTGVCDFSQGTASPKKVWLVGDSHAQQWQAPILDLAREHKWVLKLSYLGGCPFAKVQFAWYRTPATKANAKACMDWTAKMAAAIAADAASTVLVSFYARQEFADDGSGRSQTEQYRDGLEQYWKTWTDAGARVVVLADPPLNGAVRAPDCAVLEAGNPAACAVDRGVAQPPDPLSEVASSSRNPGVSLVDLTNFFCDEHRCHSVVGNVVVYYDADHLNREFSRTLKPMIAEALGLR